METENIEQELREKTRVALVQGDEILAMFGVLPSSVLCSAEKEVCMYNAINADLAGRNIALSVMLDETKKELAKAHETIAEIKSALSRYENKVKGM